jgi:pyruvate dehydrogenase complex dehydrogenase (E1) component
MGLRLPAARRRGDPDERTWLRDETGGSVYLRLTTNPIEQPGKRADEDFRQGAIDGAYWLRKPGPNCEVVIAYQGVVAPEAIGPRAASPARRDVGVLAVTSADRLNAGWTAAQRARARGNPSAKSHIETLTAALPRHCKIVTVIDGHPATLAGRSVHGHQTIPLGVGISARPERSGSHHFGINAEAIVQAHRSVRRTPGHFGLQSPWTEQADGGRRGARPGRWRARLNRRGQIVIDDDIVIFAPTSAHSSSASESRMRSNSRCDLNW